MKYGKITSVWTAIVMLGCAGGGVQNNSSGGGSKYSSDAAVQMLPYQTLRNNLLGGLCLNSNSEAIQKLDELKVLFGDASPGSPPYLSPGLARLRKHIDICDMACRDGLKICPKDLFDNASDKFDPSTVCRRITGKPISDARKAAIQDVVSSNQFDSDVAKQHAVCVSCCSSLEAQLQ